MFTLFQKQNYHVINIDLLVSYLRLIRILYALLSLNSLKFLGIGVQGLADAFILMRYPFESKEANELNVQIFETLYYGALEASCEIAIEKGPYESYKDSPISEGVSIIKKNIFCYLLLICCESYLCLKMQILL